MCSYPVNTLFCSSVRLYNFSSLTVDLESGALNSSAHTCTLLRERTLCSLLKSLQSFDSLPTAIIIPLWSYWLSLPPLTTFKCWFSPAFYSQPSALLILHNLSGSILGNFTSSFYFSLQLITPISESNTDITLPSSKPIYLAASWTTCLDALHTF